MSYGTPITKAQAQEFIDQHMRIVSDNRLLISQNCRTRNDLEAANFYYADASGSPGNCFIFDIEHLQKFINAGAERLLVFVSANPGIDGEADITRRDYDAAGNPTIILVGCKTRMINGREAYYSLEAMGDKPAVEHPPTHCIPNHPSIENLKSNNKNNDLEEETIMTFITK